MKPSLEVLELTNSQKSFNFFKVEVDYLKPFWHYHPEVELTLIAKGQGTRFVGNSILPFFDYDLVLIGENVPHQWVSVQRDGASNEQAFVFQFPKNIFKSFEEFVPLQSLFEAAELGLQFTNPSLEIIEIIKGFGESNKMRQIRLLMEILTLLHEDTHRKTLSTVHYNPYKLKTGQQDKVNATISYILENLEKRLTVQSLAELTHMVPQSFCRWFKKETGNSFVTFLNTSRIENACQLLLTTDLSIQQIAFDSGFESLSHFNRTFKSLKNTNPRTYKSKHSHVRI
ncbi:MAG: AraC family transcriptional regulator [Gelidibacter sp.]